MVSRGTQYDLVFASASIQGIEISVVLKFYYASLPNFQYNFFNSMDSNKISKNEDTSKKCFIHQTGLLDTYISFLRKHPTKSCCIINGEKFLEHYQVIATGTQFV